VLAWASTRSKSSSAVRSKHRTKTLKFAQKVGISTDAVAGLSSAAKKAGVDQQELQQALTKLAVSASEAGNGVKKYAEAYSALGINVKDASGNIKSADILFGELADKFASYKDSTTKTADAVYSARKVWRESDSAFERRLGCHATSNQAGERPWRCYRH
jgi:methyl-accepting chemotaxis protein